MRLASRTLVRSLLAIILLWLAVPAFAVGQEELITPHPTLPDGRQANAPFRPEHRQKNWSTFGAGNCVVASCCQNAKFFNHSEWARTFYDLTQGVPGGHYPEKLERLLKDAARKHSDLRWEQWSGQGEVGHQKLLEWSARGFPIGITWGTGKNYGYRPIAHMVSLVHADSTYWMIADNNFIEEFSTVPAPEGRRRWAMGSDEWGVVLIPPDDEWPISPNQFIALAAVIVCSLLGYASAGVIGAVLFGFAGRRNQ